MAYWRITNGRSLSLGRRCELGQSHNQLFTRKIEVAHWHQARADSLRRGNRDHLETASNSWAAWNVFSNQTGIPIALWLPQIQTGAGSPGIQTNQFGFNINWASGQTVVVEA